MDGKWFDENEIFACKSMETLFELWKTAHKKDPNPPIIKDGEFTIVNSSFSCDGVLNPLGINNGILLVAKESNLSQTADNGVICGDAITFWLQSVLYDNAHTDGKGTRFLNGLSLICNAIYDPNASVDDRWERGHLAEAAFMNINKRGGLSYNKKEELEEYANRYMPFIKKEIDLISPKIIVFCGQELDDIKNLLNLSTDEYTVIIVDHPSYWRKSNSSRLKQIKDELVRVHWTADSLHH